MRFLILFLLISTQAFATDYTRIDDQNFKHLVEVVDNYEDLKKQWQIEQIQIENYLVDVNRHRANQIALEETMAELEAKGAKLKTADVVDAEIIN